MNASSSLLGICFIVLTLLKVLNTSDKTVIDELTIGASVLFMAACIFSFLSIRTKKAIGERYEGIADICFLGGLVTLFITTLLFSFNVIK